MKYPRIILIALISIFFVIQIFLSMWESITYDEPVHMQEGLNHLHGKFNTIDAYNPPFIKEAIALTLITEKSPISLDIPTLFFSRVSNAWLGVLMLLVIYRITKKYFGVPQALFAVFLSSFEPTVLAHSHYVSLDVGTALLCLVAYLSFIKIVKEYTFRRALLLGVHIGLACASRISSIAFLGLSLIASFVYIYKDKSVSVLYQYKKRIIGVFIFILLIIWATYGFTFSVVVKERADATRVSSRLLEHAQETHNYVLASFIWASQHMKIPLGDFIASIKNSSLRNNSQTSYFFLGNTYIGNRIYFFPITLFLKLPLALWIFFAIAIYTHRKKWKHIALFIIPIGSILFVLCLGGYQPWIRYALPLVPFLCIVASTSISQFTKRKIVFVILCLFYLISTFSYFPHFISYANELAGERNTHYKLFTDSNIDWGQALQDFGISMAKTKPRHISFSYFGRDNGDHYGLVSNMPYGGYTFEDICAFHEIEFPQNNGPHFVVISISNWHGCGYEKLPQFSERKIKQVFADSFLFF